MTPSEQAQLVRSILLLDPAHDLYRTLGVDSSAGPAAVQQSYLRRARDTHPDKNQAEGADEAFKRVAHARSVLSDSARRTRYDAECLAGGAPISVTSRRRPCERRATRRRKAQQSAQQSFAEGSQHAEGSQDHDDAGSDSDDSAVDPWVMGEEFDFGSSGGSSMPGGVWGSWQPRSQHPPAAGAGAGAHSGKVQKKARRRASGRDDSAAAAAAAAATRTVGSAGARGGGQGRGQLGKRPWRRAAREAAKKEAKQGKARAKARKHLQ